MERILYSFREQFHFYFILKYFSFVDSRVYLIFIYFTCQKLLYLKKNF